MLAKRVLSIRKGCPGDSRFWRKSSTSAGKLPWDMHFGERVEYMQELSPSVGALLFILRPLKKGFS